MALTMNLFFILLVWAVVEIALFLLGCLLASVACKLIKLVGLIND
jgi:uncharacterized Tic20 family protein